VLFSLIDFHFILAVCYFQSCFPPLLNEMSIDYFHDKYDSLDGFSPINAISQTDHCDYELRLLNDYD